MFPAQILESYESSRISNSLFLVYITIIEYGIHIPSNLLESIEFMEKFRSSSYLAKIHGFVQSSNHRKSRNNPESAKDPVEGNRLLAV